jgi:hypothetical protein
MEGGRWNREYLLQCAVTCRVVYISHVVDTTQQYHHLPSLLYTGEVSPTFPVAVPIRGRCCRLWVGEIMLVGSEAVVHGWGSPFCHGHRWWWGWCWCPLSLGPCMMGVHCPESRR